MFKATLSDVDLMKVPVSIISEIIDEGIFTVSASGMSLVAPDRTMVSVVDFKLPPTAFDDFRPEPVEIGVNLPGLASVLKRAKTGDKLTLELSDKSRLKVRIEGKGKRVFEIPLLNIKQEKPPIENLNFGVGVDIDSSLLEESIADAEVVGEVLTLEAGNDSLRIYTKGETTKTELEIKRGQAGLHSLDVKDAARASYPLEYLKKMIKGGKIVRQIKLDFGQDYPLQLGFKVIDKMSLNFVLAPRIQE